MRVLSKLGIIVTISVMMLVSCVPPKSVRPTGTYLSSNRVPVRQKTPLVTESQKNKEHTDDINSAQNKDSLAKNIDNSIPSGEAIAGLLPENNFEADKDMVQQFPSLMKQLRTIAAGQVQIQNEINDLKNMVNNIDKRLSGLEKEKTVGNNISSRNKSNLILSDEAVNKRKSQQRNILKPKKHSNQEANNTKRTENFNANSLDNNKDFEAELADIKETIKKQDYSKAISELQEMMKKSKDPVTINFCNFYLGESHYGMKQYDKAVEYFNKVMQQGDSEISDDALIKVANSKYELGDRREAEEYFKKFVNSYPKSEHLPIARKMLQQL